MLSFRLALFSIKKRKEAYLVVTLFIIFAVMFMDLGISVYQRANKMFFEKTEELHETHFIAPCTSKTFRTEYKDYIESAEGVVCFEQEEAVFMPSSTNNCNDLKMGAFLYDCDAKRQIAPFSLIREDTTIPREQAIYVPIQLEAENVQLGKPYELTYRGTTYSFIVAGYFETTTYCNINCGFYKYFVPKETYQRIADEVGKAYMLTARFAGNEQEVIKLSETLKTSFLNDTTYASDQQNLLQNALSYDDMHVRTILNLLIGVAMIFGISLLIFIVVAVMIMNNVREDINRSMESIGTLQSMGYTLTQIRRSYLYEYLLLGGTGGLLGVLASYIGNLVMGPFLTSLSGFVWKGYIHPIGDLVAVAVMLCLVSMVSTIAVKRLKGLTPVATLNQRNGSSRGYRCFYPLQNGRLSLNLHIAVKNLFVYLKSNLVYASIVAIGSFAIGVAILLFLNFTVHTDALLSVTGFAVADLQVKVSQGCDAAAFSEEIAQMNGVRKTNISATGDFLKYNNETITTLIEEDFDKIEYVNPYEGSFPQTKNEVLISAMLSEASGKGVGDSITLCANGIERDYLVSGIFSSTNGFVAYMNQPAIRLLYPDFLFNCVDIYLEEGITSDDFQEHLQSLYKVSVDHESESVAEQKIARLLADYGVSSVSYSIWKDGVEICSGDSSAFQIADITDLKGFASAQLRIYARNLSSLVVVVFITMLLICGCVLQVTTKNEIRKNRTEYGTLKALGYTTGDITTQVTLRFLLTTVIGCLLGALLAFSLTPMMFSSLFKLMGVTQISMNGYPFILLLCNALLSFMLYLVARVTCRRISTITAYELLTE